MTTMPYVNIFTKDIKKLSKFYIDVFGLEEDMSLRSPIFRGIRTSKSYFGFNAPEAYELLNLSDKSNTKGIKFFLNFDVRSMKEVDRLVALSVKRGAKIVKDHYRTYYNWYQAVLTDPEDNLFRINKRLPGKLKSSDWNK